MKVATHNMDMSGLMRWLARDRRPDAVLIAGPTACGKSALALRVAEMLGGAIVNADSLQVYRDLAILSARPADKDMAGVPHHLFGHVDGAAEYSVGHWLKDVGPCIDAICGRGLVPVITGGTGLYFSALTEGLSDMPAVEPAIRSEWRARLAAEGAPALYRHLQAVDPAAANLVPGDGQRIVRALEILQQTGRSITTWQGAGQAGPIADLDLAKIVLTCARDRLRERIGARFDAMMAAGALGEVERLAAQTLDPARPVMKAIGVPQLLSYLDGRLTLDEAVERAKVLSGQYAKRQDTWFRNQMDDSWERMDITPH